MSTIIQVAIEGSWVNSFPVADGSIPQPPQLRGGGAEIKNIGTALPESRCQSWSGAGKNPDYLGPGGLIHDEYPVWYGPIPE